MNDLLFRCTKALRETTADEDGSAALRERIEHQVLRVRVRRRRARMLLVAAGVSAIAGLASAASIVVGRTRAATGSPRLAAVAAIDHAVPMMVRATVIAVPIPLAAAQADASPRAPRHLLAPAPRMPTEPGDRAYAVAHRAHFVQADWSAALALWDRYLGLAPAGVLVPEAHWNRAICLIRLGRLEEARTELQRFRTGAWGSYRQADAERLIQTLDRPQDTAR